MPTEVVIHYVHALYVEIYIYTPQIKSTREEVTVGYCIFSRTICVAYFVRENMKVYVLALNFWPNILKSSWERKEYLNRESYYLEWEYQFDIKRKLWLKWMQIV
jgi:hypothetical protein